MRLLFFDLEFADGKVPGSIYSMGYTVTNEDFEILEEATDILINPESSWNAYVVENILAYPKEEVEAAPTFLELYPRIRALFDSADLVVGFSLSNDLRALRKDCARYGLEKISFKAFDTERLCKLSDEHKEAHGLGGYVTAWCGEEPDNRHRSDGDALATMMLFRAICRAKHVTPEMMVIAYPECAPGYVDPEKAQKKKESKHKHQKKSPRKYFRRPKKKAEGASEGNAVETESRD